MRAGRLRFRAAVERPVEAQNDLNEVEQTWECWKVINVDIEPIRGSERYAMKQEKADVDIRITARASATRGIAPKMRMVFYDHGQQRRRYFDIESVIEVRERNVMTEIYCKEAA